MTPFSIYFFTILVCLGSSGQTFCQNYKEGYIEISQGTRIYYREYGTRGDTLLLIHGGPGQNMYGISDDLIPIARKHVVIMYDQRGCGQSITDEDSVSFEDHIDDINSIRAHFHIKKLILAGQSWGCMLATLYASRFVDNIERMVFISPGPPTRRLFDERFAAFGKIDSIGQTRVAILRQQLIGNDPVKTCEEIHSVNERLYFFDDKKIKKKKGDYCKVSDDVIRMQARTGLTTLRSLGSYDLSSHAKNISIPVLIIEGKHSPVPVAEIDHWKKILPNCKVYLYDKSGHGYPFVEQPGLFFSDVIRFIKGKWPRRSGY